ncbi:FtsW/RodA/SpoVE family cell cycle protein [Capnocytophaga sputigena]|jgi:putative cell division protein ftsW|uniref:Probable peptidoglycan glycosyltransferase FtsW n=1 Tax=Capnocytophaga sputigena TaxID=1019 RepID=A0AAX2I8V4_CAPSP|nr:FtsW/RodA/SpoVE family cell cycle protein [Capnocytophaga sputigena]ATA70241.1 cell division protein FtsW [Capnocytophaga sputigena]ATA85086.1 cell division protein FtsW [Capnocytophaga sputigena]EEB65425.1 cell cycle protein, FtsW/RodA/SpoVE family [Capnocytophaga sputigena ATCC 33612]SQA74821.1 Cell division protein FtsW [Capnocytophaga sputigena]VEI53536.1 Cell division protein FtsW [Capnocytophaga sputigena]
MQEWLSKHIKGDKGLWALILIFSLATLVAVYSTSTNLVYVVGKGTPTGYLFKQLVFVVVGFFVLYGMHKISYTRFRLAAKLLIPVAVLFLLMALFTGTTIEGANASRWLNFGFFSFQPSAFALVVLMAYVASYLTKTYGKKLTFKETILPLWLPVGTITALVMISNLSTAVLILTSVLILIFLGRFPFKHILSAMLIAIAFLGLFFLVVKAFPDAFPNRVDTWMSRIESFTASEDEKEGYQIERSKMAIAKGIGLGQGPGKSTMKNFLPQSSSDFIFAIITEEWGTVGAIFIMLLYILLLVRIVAISLKAPTLYGQLLALGLGIPILLQAVINMGVAVELFPVTGQNLPLISSGGTSFLVTCIALGGILSVSVQKRKDGKMEKDKTEADIEEELAESALRQMKKNTNVE